MSLRLSQKHGVNPSVMTEVFKVVYRPKDSFRRSMWVVGDACLSYSPGIATRSPFGWPLFAFESLKAARDWCARDYRFSFELWRAEAELTNPQPKSMLKQPNDERIGKFWSGGLVNAVYVCPVSPGTVLCDSITLTERIEW